MGRQSADERREAPETGYRELIQRASYGIFRARTDGRFLDVNPALVTMLGYDSAEDLRKVHAITDVYRDPSELTRVLDLLARDERARGVEVEWKRRDGTPIIVQLSGRAVRSPSGQVTTIEAFAEDLTQQRLFEEQLRQTHKIEAVGRLAGGIAHEFNNLLLIIMGRSELLLDRLPPEDSSRRDITIIQDTAKRAATLIQQLLAFGGKQAFRPEEVDLDGLIADLAPMLRALIGEDIELVIVPRSGGARVHGDPRQLQQVIMNLAVNARDAMPKGGRLTIQTLNLVIDHAFPPRHSGAKLGPHVLLVVSDTGIGMDPDTRARIFDPFFTTKDVGEGTGLGLSAVNGIVRQHHGHVVVESEPDRGSTFKIYLPQLEEPGRVSQPEELRTPVGEAAGTILLVEDEAAVRTLMRENLLLHGYTVLEAADAGEALLISERHAGPIHLLLTDVVMPRMSGPELAQRLRSVYPAMKALFISGYDENALRQHGVLAAGTPLLQKPFMIAQLARKVRDMLA